MEASHASLAEVQFFISSTSQFLQLLCKRHQDADYRMQAELLLKLSEQQTQHLSNIAALMNEYQTSMRHLMEVVETQKAKLNSAKEAKVSVSFQSTASSYIVDNAISCSKSNTLLTQLDQASYISDLEEQLQNLTEGNARLRRSVGLSQDIILEKQSTIDRLTEKLHYNKRQSRRVSTAEAVTQCTLTRCDKGTDMHIVYCDAATTIDYHDISNQFTVRSDSATSQTLSQPNSQPAALFALSSPVSDDSLLDYQRSQSNDSSVEISPHRDSLDESLVQYSFADMSQSLLRSSVETADAECRNSSSSRNSSNNSSRRRSSEDSNIESNSLENDSVCDQSVDDAGGDNSGRESPDSLLQTWEGQVSSNVEDSFALIQHYYE